MKVLYVGPVYRGSTALHRRNAIQQLGHEVTTLDTSIPFLPSDPSSKFLRECRRVLAFANRTFDPRFVHFRMKRLSAKLQPDLVWVDKGQHLTPRVLEKCRALSPKSKWVNYSPDDMVNPKNQTPRYLGGLPLYDLMVTTKSYNVDELKALGAKNVYLVGNGFDPSIHNSVVDNGQQVNSTKVYDVVFVGAAESERVDSIRFLAEHDVHTDVFGTGKQWFDLASHHPNVTYHPGFVADADYREILHKSRIALCFLRKQNRDKVTSRSIEIPACGAFMLAERTEEHQALFQEGVEAEFFENNEELLDKCLKYLKDWEARDTIARNGLKRCHISGYSNHNRIESVFNYLFS